jgi:hypothetical protein
MAFTVSVATAGALLELGAQVLTVVVEREWADIRRQPNHLFRASTVPTLFYELKRNYA